MVDWQCVIIFSEFLKERANTSHDAVNALLALTVLDFLIENIIVDTENLPLSDVEEILHSLGL